MSSPTPLRVQVGTFNCNLQGTSSYQPDLTPWLVPTLSEKSQDYATNPVEGRRAPDIYAVGFQELLPLPTGFAGRGWDAINNTDREIRKAIRHQSALTRSDGRYPSGGGPEDYACLARIDMVGIVLYVYARERVDAGSPASVASRVKEIRTGEAGTGLLGLMGNKGGVGVRIVLKGLLPGTPDEVLTFVCAHLAAHDHMVPRRNADWANIVRRLVFAPDAVEPLPPKRLDAPGLNGAAPDTEELKRRYEENKGKISKDGVVAPKALDDKEYSIYDTTHLFVFGDLNYRIAFNTQPAPHLARQGQHEEKLKKSDIKRKILQSDWRTLATYDQLSIEHKHPDGARVFHGLTEPHLPAVGFGPTYKFKVDKSKRGSKAESKADEKSATGKAATGQELSGKRVPGWTDRILWASIGEDAETQGVEAELYRSVMSYTHSDHKPVTAILQLPAASQLHPSNKALRLAQKAPFAIDPSWRTKRALGQALDKLLGLIWTTLIAAGAGSLVAGIAEVAVLFALAAWWLGAGGGAQGDFGWLLSSLGRGGA